MLLALVSACGADGVASSPSPVPVTPTPVPTSTPARTFVVPELKYLLIEHYGGVFYCDPDYYPVSRPGGEEQNAAATFPAIQADEDEFSAILAHLGLGPSPAITDELRLNVYREHKKLRALTVMPEGDLFTYSLRIGEMSGDSPGYLVEGTVTGAGVITETNRTESFNTCPICLAADTLISTPAGETPVSAIRAGDIVWSLDVSGDRVPSVVVRTGYTETPVDHELVRLVLSDNRTVMASPGHPLADGRMMGALSPGDTVYGAMVVTANRIPYGGQRTHDILPSGTTGVYFADGIALASTLGAR